MKRFTLSAISLAMGISLVCAEDISNATATFTRQDSVALLNAQKKISAWDRLHVGGYGEVAMSRNFYSDNYLRYTEPGKYAGGSHGRFDLPHVVIYLGYDFGYGRAHSPNRDADAGFVQSASFCACHAGDGIIRTLYADDSIVYNCFILP